MRKTFTISIVAISSVLFALACQNEFFTEKGIPEVKTTGVTVLEDGATFYAEILSDGGQKIVERGFTWTESSDSLTQGTEYIFLGPTDGKSEFSVTVSNSVKKSGIYNLRAFVQTETTISFGNKITFTGNGSRSPRLNGVSPSAAVSGDTVLITGEYFSYNVSSCSVLFGNNPGKVVSAATGEIKVIVPVTTETDVKIRLSVSGNASSNELDFNFIEPDLIAFSPKSGTFGDIITLEGNYFSIDTSIFRVYFNNTRAEVTELTRTSCRVKVPVGNNSSPSAISVRYVNSYSFDEMFTLDQAVITGVSPARTSRGETIVITGLNFNPDILMNRVEIGGHEATVESSSPTLIVVTVPELLLNGLYPLAVTTLSGFPVVWSENIEIVGVWERMTDFPGSSRVGATSFVVNGRAYLGTGVLQDLSMTDDFWIYEPENDKWSRIDNFPATLGYVTGFSIAGNGYATLGKNNSLPSRDLRSFDPESGVWQTQTAIPGQGSTMDSPGFIIDGKAYIPSAGEMYEFNPATGQWTRKSYPSELGYFGGGAAFSVNGKGYLGVGWSHDNSKDVGALFEYDPVSDSWSAKAPFPGTLRDNAVSFSLPNGKGYVGLGYSQALDKYLNDMWEYDPVADVWSQLDNFPSSARFGAEVFVIDKSAYIVSGGTRFGFFRDCWRFTPVL